MKYLHLLSVVEKRRWLLYGVVLCTLPLLLLIRYLYYTLPFEMGQEPEYGHTRVYDRHGRLLYELLGEGGRRRYWVGLEDIPVELQQVVIALEDQGFYGHIGVDVGAVSRAVWLNVRYGTIVSGGSTIPQQLARNLLGTDRPRTMGAKLEEATLALRLSRQYSKDEILEWYLNAIYYGNGAYGVETAAHRYFGKSIKDLHVSEWSVLAGLPKSPVGFSPITAPHQALQRRGEVLDMLVVLGVITPKEKEEMVDEMPTLRVTAEQIHAPHFVQEVLGRAVQRYGAERVYGTGITLHTTVDLGVYQQVQRILQRRIEYLAAFRVGNGGVVVVDNSTGEVISFHGSVDYFDEAIQGTVSMPTAYRQPGSVLKPFVYLHAFEQGFAPASIVYDVEERFLTEEGHPYTPQNYDGQFHGPVSIREALANSYNIPAVSMVQRLGVSSVMQTFRRVGLQVWGQDSPATLGVALALGNGEVRLLDVVNAYRTLANHGYYGELQFLREVDGEQVLHLSRQRSVFAPEHGALVTSILSDNDARRKQFGEESFLKLPFPVAAKTGTTRNFRDNWVVGYTPYYTVGVWVGNADGSAMQQVSGLTGAGPIFHDVMLALHSTLPARDFIIPSSLVEVEICSVSGLLPTEYCQERRRDLFVQGEVPSTYDTWWQPGPEGLPRIVYPSAVASWALDKGLPVEAQEESHNERCILNPRQGDQFRIAPDRPPSAQQLLFRACAEGSWTLSGELVGEGQEWWWELSSGRYVLEWQGGERREEVEFQVE